MALKIRLARGGAKKRPFYHVVIADSRSPRDGRFIERVGMYNPMVPRDHPERIVLKDERIKYWLGVGARPTDRVARFLGQAGIAEAPPVPEQTRKNQLRAKTLERMKAAEDAAKAAKAAKDAEEAVAAVAAEESPAEAPPAAEEAPAEAAPAEEKAEEAAAEPAEPAPAEEQAAQEAEPKAEAEAEQKDEPAAETTEEEPQEGKADEAASEKASG